MVVFVKVRMSKLFWEIMKGHSKIILQVIFHIDGNSIIQGNKKYNSGVELQSRELNLALRKTAMIVRGTVCN